VVVVPLPADEAVVVVVVGVVASVVEVGVVVVVASGPFETFSWTLAPLRAWPPLGLCATTVPRGWSDGTWTMVGLKPLAARFCWATSDV